MADLQLKESSVLVVKVIVSSISAVRLLERLLERWKYFSPYNS